MPMSRLWAGSLSSRSPSHRMRPASGRRNPATQRSSVVFPHPLGPSRVKNSPAWISNETSASASMSAYRLLSLSTVSVVPITSQPRAAVLRFSLAAVPSLFSGCYCSTAALPPCSTILHGRHGTLAQDPVYEQHRDEHRHQQNGRGGGGAAEVAAAHLAVDDDRDGGPRTVIEEDRGADFGDGLDPGEDPTRRDSRKHEPGRHPGKTLQGRDAQADGRLLHRGINLVKNCRSRSHRVREALDKVRQQQDEEGAGEDHRGFVEGHDEGHADQDRKSVV